MDKGPLKILVPPEPDKHYVMAIDSALNVSGGDYVCAQIVEWRHNEQVAVWHGRAHPDEFAHKAYVLGHLYNTAFIAVEANAGGGGGTILSILLNKFNYPNLYFRERLDTVSRQISTERPGWMTTGKSKPTMYNDMSEVIRSVLDEDEAPQIILHDRETVEELACIQYDPAKRGQDAFGAVAPDHDDYSDALCISFQARKQFFPSPDPDPDIEFNRTVEQLGIAVPARHGDLRHRDKPGFSNKDWCSS